MAAKVARSKALKSAPAPAVTRAQSDALVGFAPLFIVLFTASAFLPSLQNGFVSWDDHANLLNNPHYRGLGWAQLRWMFTTFHMGHYQPLSWMTLGLDYLLWGLNPLGYHLTALALHCANGVLFYLLCIRLLGAAQRARGERMDSTLRLAAGFAALIFAVHPLRVESVAWATERRDVLSGLFFMSTLLCYLRANEVATVDTARRRWLLGTLAFYLMALLSKVICVTLPVVLLVLDVYPLGRLGGDPRTWLKKPARAVWLEKALLLLIAVPFGATAFIAQGEAGSLRPFEDYDLASRLVQSVHGIVFYLWKMLVPFGLSPLYEIMGQLEFRDWRFILAAIAVAAITAVLFLARRRWPAGLAAWAVYVVILGPVLGVAQNGPQIVADRYSYLSCLSWAVLLGAGFLHVLASLDGKLQRTLLIGAVALVPVLLGALTWQQTKIWRDSERLWRHVLSIDPNSSVAHNNLGEELSRSDKGEEAERHYREALKIRPDYATAHNNVGVSLFRRGALEQAVAHYRHALKISPDNATAHNNLGLALTKQGKIAEAQESYQRALRLQPNYAEAHYNLGNLFAQRGDFATAILRYQEAVKNTPDFMDAHVNLAQALFLEGKPEAAVQHWRRAVEINPDFAEGHYYLGRTMAEMGRAADAIEHLRRAVQIQPEFAEAHESLAQVLSSQGRKEEALQHYEQAVRIFRSRKEIAAPRSAMPGKFP